MGPHLTGNTLFRNGTSWPMEKQYFTRHLFSSHFFDSFHADGTLIQLNEHLQAYFTKWKKNVNEKNSISQAATKIHALKQKYQHNECSEAVPATLEEDSSIS